MATTKVVRYLVCVFVLPIGLQERCEELFEVFDLWKGVLFECFQEVDQVGAATAVKVAATIIVDIVVDVARMPQELSVLRVRLPFIWHEQSVQPVVVALVLTVVIPVRVDASG